MSRLDFRWSVKICWRMGIAEQQCSGCIAAPPSGLASAPLTHSCSLMGDLVPSGRLSCGFFVLSTHLIRCHKSYVARYITEANQLMLCVGCTWQLWNGRICIRGYRGFRQGHFFTAHVCKVYRDDPIRGIVQYHLRVWSIFAHASCAPSFNGSATVMGSAH